MGGSSDRDEKEAVKIKAETNILTFRSSVYSIWLWSSSVVATEEYPLPVHQLCDQSISLTNVFPLCDQAWRD